MTTKTQEIIKYQSITSGIREVITHVQFPEDDQMVAISESKIREGISKSYIVTERSLQILLGHLFVPSTVYNYARTSDIYTSQTILNFPKPIIVKEHRIGKKGRPRLRHYYLAQEVATYVKYVEKLREQEMLNRPQGYMVLPKPRIQSFVEKQLQPENVQKFKVNSVNHFLTTLKKSIL